MERLQALRASFVALGVDGVAFDRFRDEIKARVEADLSSSPSAPNDVWNRVCDEVRAVAMNRLFAP